MRWWKSTLSTEAASAPAVPEAAVTAFVPVQLAPEAPTPLAAPARSDSGVRLHWGELRIELALGFDRANLRAVLQALAR